MLNINDYQCLICHSSLSNFCNLRKLYGKGLNFEVMAGLVYILYYFYCTYAYFLVKLPLDSSLSNFCNLRKLYGKGLNFEVMAGLVYILYYFYCTYAYFLVKLPLVIFALKPAVLASFRSQIL